MDDDLMRAFEMGVADLERGASLEEAVQRHPDLVEELRPLLQTFVRTQSVLRSIQPPAGSQAASRARFLQEAESKLSGHGAPASAPLQEERPLPPSRVPQVSTNGHGKSTVRASRPPAAGGGFLRRLLPALTSRAAVVFAAVAIVIVAGAGVVNASTQSLPGTPLYGIKQVVENTQLVLSPSEQSRAQLEGQFDEQHSEEAREVTERGWTVPLEFGGNLESVDGTRWSIAGVTVIVPSGVTVQGKPEVGLYVAVRGTAQADRTVLASQIAVEGIVFQGRVDEIATDFWRIDGRKIFTSNITSTEGNPKIGDLVEVSAMPLSDGNLLARDIRLAAPAEPAEDSGGPVPSGEDRGIGQEATQTPAASDSINPTLQPTDVPGSAEGGSITQEPTGTSVSGASGEKTAEPTPAPSAEGGGNLAPTATPRSGGSDQPVEPTQTPRPAESEAPASTPHPDGSTTSTPAPSPQDTKFQGLLQSIDGTSGL